MCEYKYSEKMFLPIPVRIAKFPDIWGPNINGSSLVDKVLKKKKHGLLVQALKGEK